MVHFNVVETVLTMLPKKADCCSVKKIFTEEENSSDQEDGKSKSDPNDDEFNDKVWNTIFFYSDVHVRGLVVCNEFFLHKGFRTHMHRPPCYA